MNNQDEINMQVLNELEDMRQQIAKLEILEAKRRNAEKCWAEVMAMLVGRLGVSKDQD